LQLPGAKEDMIWQVVIFEGVIIGLISWVFGALLPIPLGWWLGKSLGNPLLARPLDYGFDFPALWIWLGLVIAIAALSSLIPAQRATHLTIRDSVAYELK
jgi:putative ABC transport system permease protein